MKVLWWQGQTPFPMLKYIIIKNLKLRLLSDAAHHSTLKKSLEA